MNSVASNTERSPKVIRITQAPALPKYRSKKYEMAYPDIPPPLNLTATSALLKKNSDDITNARITEQIIFKDNLEGVLPVNFIIDQANKKRGKTKPA